MKQLTSLFGLLTAILFLVGIQTVAATYVNAQYYAYSNSNQYSYTPQGWNMNAPGTWASGQAAVEHWPAQWVGYYDPTSPSHRNILNYNQYAYYANAYPRHWHGSPYGYSPYIPPYKRAAYYW